MHKAVVSSVQWGCGFAGFSEVKEGESRAAARTGGTAVRAATVRETAVVRELAGGGRVGGYVWFGEGWRCLSFQSESQVQTAAGMRG